MPKHSGWARTFSGTRPTRARGARTGRPMPGRRQNDLSPEQLQAAIAASDAGSDTFHTFVKTLPPREND